MNNQISAIELDTKIDQVKGRIHSVAADHAPACLVTGFGSEGMVLIDLICKHFPSIEILTLDTGRLPDETYDLMQRVRERYGVRINVFFPDAAQVERYVREHGPNAFYQSVDLRKRCCHLRKVAPLRRALSGKSAWVTGLRREQSLSREKLQPLEWDAEHGLYKANPVYDWNHHEVWSYIRRFQVPYNTLHDRDFPSIGCAPCTRAISRGEDIRAGRWWWESPDIKECGLHLRSRTVAMG
jgi:phosophoadenylyl-sulfate reductase (thioredoxin)/thioredoxin-dependent adenylylsulfate APS reductase